MSKNAFNRREFLRLGTISTLGLALASYLPHVRAQAAGSVEWWTVLGGEIRDQSVAEALIAAFAASHPNITINPTYLPDDGYSERMTTVIGTGSGVPDVAFLWLTQWLPAAADHQSFVDMSSFDLGQYVNFYIDSFCRYQDTLIGLPLGVGSNMFFYNKTLFENAGLDVPNGASPWSKCLKRQWRLPILMPVSMARRCPSAGGRRPMPLARVPLGMMAL